MTKYIDFDDVIFDVEDLLFDEYLLAREKGIELDKIKYMQEKDWFDILSKAPEINESVRIINELDDDTAILTKIHSLENEGTAKVKLIRSLNIRKPIILVPYTVSKADIVSPKGNVLIDDGLFNLDEWSNNGGISLFFSKNGSDYDTWQVKNTKYQKVKSLEVLKKYI